MLMHEIIPNSGLLIPWKVTSIESAIRAVHNIHPPISKPYLKRLEEIPEIFSKNYQIGIEIECENMEGISNQFFLNSWRIKSDGSLRNNGVEFISPAMLSKDAAKQLAILYAWIECIGAKPNFSWRTSTHIHVDCLHLPVEEFKRFLLLYLLFEESLFQFAHPGRRETNIFCTPITRSNFYALEHFMLADSKKDLSLSLNEANSEVKKYSALNLNHLYDFGTIEFRHLRGTPNPSTIAVWLDVILSLFNAAKRLSTVEIHEQIANLNTTSSYNKFTEDVFGDRLGNLLTFPGHFIAMSKGVSLTKEIVSGNSLFRSIKPSPDSGLQKFIALQYKKEKKDPLLGKKPRVRIAEPPAGLQPSTVVPAGIVVTEAPLNPNTWQHSVLGNVIGGDAMSQYLSELIGQLTDVSEEPALEIPEEPY